MNKTKILKLLTIYLTNEEVRKAVDYLYEFLKKVSNDVFESSKKAILKLNKVLDKRIKKAKKQNDFETLKKLEKDMDELKEKYLELVEEHKKTLEELRFANKTYGETIHSESTALVVNKTPIKFDIDKCLNYYYDSIKSADPEIKKLILKKLK